MDELAGETVAMLSGKKAHGRAFGAPDRLQRDTAGWIHWRPMASPREERRLWEETRRVLACPELAVNATAVRVPVFFGHSLCVHASFERGGGPARGSRGARKGRRQSR